MFDAEVTSDFISVSGMLKAIPASEGGRRVIYFEASNEGLDQQGEIVAARALKESADYFRRYGIIDIDHYSQIGHRLGIPDYAYYEVGRPVDVGQRDGSTFVKAEVYQGAAKVAEKANMLWASLTEVSPPQRWYPSVAGKVLGKSSEVGPDGTQTTITKVRWSGVGLSKTPVNAHVGVCTTVPLGVFAKCWNGAGLDLGKALTAGYATDSAAMTGGAALKRESLDPKLKDYWSGVHSYFDFRNRLAGDLRSGKAGPSLKAADLVRHAASRFGLSDDDAAEHVERFMRDLETGLTRKAA